MPITIKNFVALAARIQYIAADHLLTEYELETILELCQAMQEPTSTEPAKVDLVPLFDAIVDGKKIEAIKLHRMMTGFGLKESKDEVERLMGKTKSYSDVYLLRKALYELNQKKTDEDRAEIDTLIRNVCVSFNITL